MAKVAPAVRVSQGPLELVAFYDGPNAHAVREYWFGVTYAASRLGHFGFAPPVPMPEQAAYALAGTISERLPTQIPPPLLRYLISPQVAIGVRQRVGLLPQGRISQSEEPTAPPAAAPK